MAHLPSLERFVELAQGADFVPVYRELLSDALSPVQAFRRLDRGQAAGLFESVIGGEKVGRYSFVASDPFLLLEAHGTRVKVSRRNAAGSKEAWKTEEFEARQSARNAARAGASGPRRPPAGAAAVHRRRRRLRRLRHGPLRRTPAQRAEGRPRACPIWRSGCSITWSSSTTSGRRVHVVALADLRGAEDDDEIARRHQAACKRVDGYIAALNAPDDGLQLADIDARGPVTLPYKSNFTQTEFEAGGPQVRRVHPRRRHLSGRHQPAAGDRLRLPAVRALPHAAGGEPEPVHVLPADAGDDARRAARRRSWSASSTAR